MSKAKTLAMNYAEGNNSDLEALTHYMQQAINYGRALERRAAERRLDRLFEETDGMDHGDWASGDIYRTILKTVIRDQA